VNDFTAESAEHIEKIILIFFAPFAPLREPSGQGLKSLSETEKRPQALGPRCCVQGCTRSDRLNAER